jgi:hypothetical protein
MTEVILFTLNGIVIYLVADWIIRRMEAKRGEVLKNRQIIFFVIFLSLALITFELLQTVLNAS